MPTKQKGRPMIRYALRCSEGHSFDQWFDNMADYDHKAESGELTCPECGGHEVRKGIMAPNVGKPAAAPLPACAKPGCAGGGCPAMMGM